MVYGNNIFESISAHCIQHNQGSKLTVASSKFATGKSHLPRPAKNVGNKKFYLGILL